MRASTRGFTLVELMVVVAVIGIGGGIALFNMSEQVAEARARADAEAMAQFIQTEQRAARQRMVGLRLQRDPSHTKLTFEEVNRCADSAPPRRSRPRQFLPTTTLEISSGADSVCWESTGEVASDTGSAFMQLPGSPRDSNGPLTLTVNAGNKSHRTLRSTKAGPVVNSVAGATGTP